MEVADVRLQMCEVADDSKIIFDNLLSTFSFAK